MNRLSNINALLLQGLPVMSNLDDFSKEARLSKDTIYRLSKYSTEYYKTYEISKKSGGVRLIAQPSRMMKGIQGWILVQILNKLTPSINSTGFRKGYNLLKNAMPHLGAVEILNLDIKDFFNSTKSKKVFDLFRSIGYNILISHILTKICCYQGNLPQGGPCSPALANLTNSKLDRRIAKFCAQRSIIYTRYADDLTFSIPQLNYSKFLLKVITEIVEDEGYNINTKKTRIAGNSSQKKITGLILSDQKVGIGRQQYRLLRAKIHAYSKLKRRNQKKENHINGWLSFIHDVDLDRYNLLKKYCQKLSKKIDSKTIKHLSIINHS
jgi:retron-type reverse transcriptase